MSTPFSRITRSLNTGDLRSAALWMIGVMVMLSVWGVWFFRARVTLWETSRTAGISNKEIRTLEFPGNRSRVRERRQRNVTARFSPDAATRIRVGQRASVSFDTSGKHTGNVPATVTRVRKGSQNEPARVELTAFFEKAALPAGKSVQVKVGVEQVSPAVLVMRASGLFNK